MIQSDEGMSFSTVHASSRRKAVPASPTIYAWDAESWSVHGTDGQYLSDISLRIGDMPLDAFLALGERRAALITRLEMYTVYSFGKESEQLRGWLLGCKKFIRWNNQKGVWVD